MGREADPTIKAGLLEQVLVYLLTKGVQDLRLRPLATEIGTNARMLIYHFGTKEQMIVDALGLAQAKQLEALGSAPPPNEDAITELLYLWDWFSADSFIPFSKLLFEVEAQSFGGNTVYKTFAQETLLGWQQFIQTRFGHCDATTANLIVGTTSGLLLDYVITNDRHRIDQAFKRFAELVASLLEGKK